MIRMITAGACALFLIGCTAEKVDDAGKTPSTLSIATDSSATFELGKDI